MALIVAHSFWKEVKKDAFFIGLGFTLGCYTTYQYLEKLEDKYLSAQNSQPYGLEKKVTK